MQRHLSGLLGRWFTLVVLPFALQQCSLNEELQAEELDVIQVTSGFLFIDGKYLAPPYDIECEEGVLTINGEEYKLEYFRDPPPQPEPSTEPETQANSSADRDPGEASSVEVTPTRFARDPDPFRRGAESYRRDAESFRNDPGRSGQGFERRDWRRWGPRGFGGYGGFRPYLYSIEMYANDVQQATLGGIVVMYPKRKPLVVYPTGDGYRLLQLLMGKTDIKSAPPKHLTPDSQSSWEQLATGFQPSGDFFERAKAELERVDAVTAETASVTDAVFLSQRLAYPLSLLAMVGVVLGFGHLLTNRPTVDPDQHDEVKGPKIIVQSLMIIALFSVVDLVLTVTATNAGAMRELNPLGSHFIDDPAMLTVFKFAVTGLSIGILYGLRRKPIAHLASWWCCLLLTLLTARWVVFQSMFL